MSDLTDREQTNVRAALRFLRARCGTWWLTDHVPAAYLTMWL